MSSYFRQMKEVRAEVGVEVTLANKKQVDEAFHQMAGVAYNECPATWKRPKQEFMSDEGRRRELVQKPKQAMR